MFVEEDFKARVSGFNRTDFYANLKKDGEAKRETEAQREREREKGTLDVVDEFNRNLVAVSAVRVRNKRFPFGFSRETFARGGRKKKEKKKRKSTAETIIGFI